MLELWPLGKVALEELYFLKEIGYGMFQPKKKPKYPIYFYKHQLGEVLILDEAVDVIIKDKKIIGWTVIVEEQLKILNLVSEGDPKEVFINAILLTSFQTQIKKLLVHYCDVFAWNYKDLKGIPREICEHKIELVADVQPIKQN